MECRNTAQCFAEIDAYLHCEPTGYPMLINTDNLEDYHRIVSRLEFNLEVKCSRVSDTCHGDMLPDIDSVLDDLSGEGYFALVGLSQYLMLRSFADLESYVNQLVSMSVHGRLILLLYHCEHLLKQLEKKDLRFTNRIFCVNGEASRLPQISIFNWGHSVAPTGSCQKIQGLLTKLESITESELNNQSVITVETGFHAGLFQQSMYAVSDGNDIFTALRKAYPEVAGCERSYGTQEQWAFLLEQLKTSKSLANAISTHIAPIDALTTKIGETLQDGDKNQQWLLWLGLKLYGAKSDSYLQHVMEHSSAVEDFEECLTMTLLEIQKDDAEFSAMYVSRKRILESLPENLPLISLYCQRTGRYEKEAVYYLTDSTEEEEHEFLRCLSIYEYTEAELLKITKLSFPEVHKYLVPFKFSPANMQVPGNEAGLREEIAKYFQDYKQQKLTNRIWPAFMEQVERYAEDRPYNKLQARSTLAAKMDRKGAQLFFFDALGVEYLSYIQNKCEQYGLIAEVSVGVCQLPSITCENKDFIPFFPKGFKKIDALDELKHHSQVYDYQQCKEPIHLFRELEIIDEQLRQIRSRLIQGAFEKAVIISDHGASRLAVISNSQSSSTIQLDEKGEHSGRCCPACSDPGIPFAAYTPNGYVVLANYDRFKGGRPANVEVHGGATLEEVVVPLITITPRPSAIEITFVEGVIQLKGREPVSVTVFANISFSDPILVVNVNGEERTYHGEFVGDQRHAKFTMEHIKRSKKYSATFYDGSKRLATELVFTVQKGTKENTSMGI